MGVRSGPRIPSESREEGGNLLIHGNVGAGQVFVDSSPSRHAITTSGNTTHSTTQSKFDGGSIYFDGTDIMAEVAAGVVNLTSGGSGPTLGGTNTWTGANTFTTYPQLSSSSAADQTVDTDDGDDSVTFGGYFNIRDSGGTIRKVPYLA